MLDADENAFGCALVDWMDGRDSGRLLLERDDGWVGEAMRPASFFAGPDDWPAYERWALDHVPPEGRVLDVGCGAGRHALQLERDGHRVGSHGQHMAEPSGRTEWTPETGPVRRTGAGSDAAICVHDPSDGLADRRDTSGVEDARTVAGQVDDVGTRAGNPVAPYVASP